MMSQASTSLTTEINAGVYPRRAASALGLAGGYRQPLHALQSWRSFDPMGDRDSHIRDSLSGGFEKANVKLPPSHEPALATLTEDEKSPAGSNPVNENRGRKFESLLSPTTRSMHANTKPDMPRAASAAQVRDLKDQMKGLKGKISSLREQARADSLKRRSIQSLRTPSPFTHAQVDQWYADQTVFPMAPGPSTQETAGKKWNAEEGVDSPKSHPAKRDSSESILNDSLEPQGGLYPPKSPLNQEPHVQPSNDEPTPSSHQIVEQEPIGHDGGADVKANDGNDERGNEEAASAYDSESGESVYHDSLPEQVSHEDREDAFDYEHFFLHSALGTISQERLRRRESTESSGSEDSVETTRGPFANLTQPPRSAVDSLQSHSRSNSLASTSTMESFATAAESRHSTIYEDAIEDHVEQVVTIPPRSDSVENTPLTAKRISFSPPVGNNSGNLTSCSSREEPRMRDRHNSLHRRPNTSQATYFHRPSVSSFTSLGTTRSFSLVNKPKASNGILTPQGSPDSELRTIRDSLLGETANRCGVKGSALMDSLPKEDQLLVQQLVESLGKCLLGLTEHGRVSPEVRMHRRRLDAARKLLEGLDD